MTATQKELLSNQDKAKANYLEYVSRKDKKKGKKRENENQSSKITFGKNTPSISEDGC